MITTREIIANVLNGYSGPPHNIRFGRIATAPLSKGHEIKEAQGTAKACDALSAITENTPKQDVHKAIVELTTFTSSTGALEQTCLYQEQKGTSKSYPKVAAKIPEGLRKKIEREIYAEIQYRINVLPIISRIPALVNDKQKEAIKRALMAATPDDENDLGTPAKLRKRMQELQAGGKTREILLRLGVDENDVDKITTAVDAVFHPTPAAAASAASAPDLKDTKDEDAGLISTLVSQVGGQLLKHLEQYEKTYAAASAISTLASDEFRKGIEEIADYLGIRDAEPASASRIAKHLKDLLIPKGTAANFKDELADFDGTYKEDMLSIIRGINSNISVKPAHPAPSPASLTSTTASKTKDPLSSLDYTEAKITATAEICHKNLLKHLGTLNDDYKADISLIDSTVLLNAIKDLLKQKSLNLPPAKKQTDFERQLKDLFDYNLKDFGSIVNYLKANKLIGIQTTDINTLANQIARLNQAAAGKKLARESAAASAALSPTPTPKPLGPASGPITGSGPVVAITETDIWKTLNGVLKAKKIDFKEDLKPAVYPKIQELINTLIKAGVSTIDFESLFKKIFDEKNHDVKDLKNLIGDMEITAGATKKSIRSIIGVSSELEAEIFAIYSKLFTKGPDPKPSPTATGAIMTTGRKIIVKDIIDGLKAQFIKDSGKVPADFETAVTGSTEFVTALDYIARNAKRRPTSAPDDSKEFTAIIVTQIYGLLKKQSSPEDVRVVFVNELLDVTATSGGGKWAFASPAGTVHRSAISKLSETLEKAKLAAPASPSPAPAATTTSSAPSKPPVAAAAAPSPAAGGGSPGPKELKIDRGALKKAIINKLDKKLQAASGRPGDSCDHAGGQVHNEIGAIAEALQVSALKTLGAKEDADDIAEKIAEILFTLFKNAATATLDEKQFKSAFDKFLDPEIFDPKKTKDWRLMDPFGSNIILVANSTMKSVFSTKPAAGAASPTSPAASPSPKPAPVILPLSAKINVTDITKHLAAHKELTASTTTADWANIASNINILVVAGKGGVSGAGAAAADAAAVGKAIADAVLALYADPSDKIDLATLQTKLKGFVSHDFTGSNSTVGDEITKAINAIKAAKPKPAPAPATPTVTAASGSPPPLPAFSLPPLSSPTILALSDPGIITKFFTGADEKSLGEDKTAKTSDDWKAIAANILAIKHSGGGEDKVGQEIAKAVTDLCDISSGSAPKSLTDLQNALQPFLPPTFFTTPSYINVGDGITKVINEIRKERAKLAAPPPVPTSPPPLRRISDITKVTKHFTAHATLADATVIPADWAKILSNLDPNYGGGSAALDDNALAKEIADAVKKLCDKVTTPITNIKELHDELEKFLFPKNYFTLNPTVGAEIVTAINTIRAAKPGVAPAVVAPTPTPTPAPAPTPTPAPVVSPPPASPAPGSRAAAIAARVAADEKELETKATEILFTDTQAEKFAYDYPDEFKKQAMAIWKEISTKLSANLTADPSKDIDKSFDSAKTKFKQILADLRNDASPLTKAQIATKVHTPLSTPGGVDQVAIEPTKAANLVEQLITSHAQKKAKGADERESKISGALKDPDYKLKDESKQTADFKNTFEKTLAKNLYEKTIKQLIAKNLVAKKWVDIEPLKIQNEVKGLITNITSLPPDAAFDAAAKALFDQLKNVAGVDLPDPDKQKIFDAAAAIRKEAAADRILKEAKDTFSKGFDAAIAPKKTTVPDAYDYKTAAESCWDKLQADLKNDYVANPLDSKSPESTEAALLSANFTTFFTGLLTRDEKSVITPADLKCFITAPTGTGGPFTQAAFTKIEASWVAEFEKLRLDVVKQAQAKEAKITTILKSAESKITGDPANKYATPPGLADDEKAGHKKLADEAIRQLKELLTKGFKTVDETKGAKVDDAKISAAVLTAIDASKLDSSKLVLELQTALDPVLKDPTLATDLGKVADAFKAINTNLAGRPAVRAYIDACTDSKVVIPEIKDIPDPTPSAKPIVLTNPSITYDLKIIFDGTINNATDPTKNGKTFRDLLIAAAADGTATLTSSDLIPLIQSGEINPAEILKKLPDLGDAGAKEELASQIAHLNQKYYLQHIKASRDAVVKAIDGLDIKIAEHKKQLDELKEFSLLEIKAADSDSQKKMTAANAARAKYKASFDELETAYTNAAAKLKALDAEYATQKDPSFVDSIASPPNTAAARKALDDRLLALHQDLAHPHLKAAHVDRVKKDLDTTLETYSSSKPDKVLPLLSAAGVDPNFKFKDQFEQFKKDHAKAWAGPWKLKVKKWSIKWESGLEKTLLSDMHQYLRDFREDKAKQAEIAAIPGGVAAFGAYEKLMYKKFCKDVFDVYKLNHEQIYAVAEGDTTAFGKLMQAAQQMKDLEDLIRAELLANSKASAQYLTAAQVKYLDQMALNCKLLHHEMERRRSLVEPPAIRFMVSSLGKKDQKLEFVDKAGYEKDKSAHYVSPTSAAAIATGPGAGTTSEAHYEEKKNIQAAISSDKNYVLVKNTGVSGIVNSKGKVEVMQLDYLTPPELSDRGALLAFLRKQNLPIYKLDKDGKPDKKADIATIGGDLEALIKDLPEKLDRREILNFLKSKVHIDTKFGSGGKEGLADRAMVFLHENRFDEKASAKINGKDVEAKLPKRAIFDRALALLIPHLSQGTCPVPIWSPTCEAGRDVYTAMLYIQEMCKDTHPNLIVPLSRSDKSLVGAEKVDPKGNGVKVAKEKYKDIVEQISGALKAAQESEKYMSVHRTRTGTPATPSPPLPSPRT